MGRGGEGGAWVVVLAGGDGRRLAGVTETDDGEPVPKQFYRGLYGGESLFQRTLRRARRVTGRRHIVPTVVRAHRRWWVDELEPVPRANVVVQPYNRGTATAVLLALMHIQRHDPAARVVLMPSDHHLDAEELFEDALREAARTCDDERVLLLGISPDGAGDDYGWIVPAEPEAPGLLRVRRFVEKPGADEQRTLRGRGGLWSSFNVAGTLPGLMRLYERTVPWLLHTFRDQVRLGRMWQASSLTELYHVVPSIDFSRDVLQHVVDMLRVLRVPPCGWTDLGTPERLARCRKRLAQDEQRRPLVWPVLEPELAPPAPERLLDWQKGSP